MAIGGRSKLQDELLQIMKNLPTKPGVYQMLDVEGHVLYIGKARNLQRRVSSYFQRQTTDPKTAAMMAQVADVKVTITSSENEALLLEANLVKEHRPRYNILLRDDKSYPYLYLSIGEDFPRLDFHRGAKNRPGRYFGPYPNAGAVRDNLALTQKLFKLRQCRDTFFKNRTRPCLQYQIQRCTAPCVSYVTKEAYHQQVEHTLWFFEGKNDQIINDLINKMEIAAQALQYENAAYYRDQIALIRKLQGQSVVSDSGNIDIIGAAEAMNEVAIVVLFVRNGRLIGDRAFFPRVPPNFESKQVLAAFIPQYYLSPLHREEPIERIITSQALPDKQWLQNALQEVLKHKILITDRKQAPFRQWQNMASTNAHYALSQHLAQYNKIAAQLNALERVLGLSSSIQRMECFDISHTSGESTVASCVVFNDQGPLTKDYRRFNIKDITPGDDYAALYQALTRHYTHLKAEEKALPDILIIDGGQGQLKQGLNVLEELQVSGVTSWLLLKVQKGSQVWRSYGLQVIKNLFPFLPIIWPCILFKESVMKLIVLPLLLIGKNVLSSEFLPL